MTRNEAQHRTRATQCMWCGGPEFGGREGATAQFTFGGAEASMHPECEREARPFTKSVGRITGTFTKEER